MIIYSEILNKEFDSVDACLEAEAEHKRMEENSRRLKAEQKKALDSAYDKAMAAIDEYLELAGITVEETDDGYKITERLCVSDEDACDIWESMIAEIMKEL